MPQHQDLPRQHPYSTNRHRGTCFQFFPQLDSEPDPLFRSSVTLSLTVTTVHAPLFFLLLPPFLFSHLVRDFSASFMDESPDSAEALIFSDPTGQIHDLLTESDNETGQIAFREETIVELMQELYKEIACSDVTQPAPPPEIPLSSSSSSSTMSFTSPLLVDHGKNGSCGASVSDSASTVMAGIDVLRPVGLLPLGMLETENGSSSLKDGSEEMLAFGEDKKMEEGGGGDSDDEWLARVLSSVSWGQAQLENRQWF